MRTACYVIALLCCALILPAGLLAADLKLEAASRGAHRGPGNIERNDWRHPVETLTFFGIADDMTVVEIWPGSKGWYTEVLAPYLRDNGRFIAASYDGSSGREYFIRGVKQFREKLDEKPAVYDKVEHASLLPPKSLAPVPPGTVDMVLTFRNVHNWIRNGIETAMFKEMFAMLKPGGVMGLVAHRGTPDMIGVEFAEKGYVAEAEVIRLAEAAGFKLDSKSDVNANSKDTKDYAEGVWTLPPTFRRGDEDRAKYAAIGESDRMTLKFIKPAAAD